MVTVLAVALAVAVAVCAGEGWALRTRTRQLATALRVAVDAVGVAESYLSMLREVGQVSAVDTTQRRTR